MMVDRLDLSLKMMEDDGSFLCHIDENEYEHLRLLCDDYSLVNAGTVIWDKRNPMNAGQGIAMQHEYIVWLTQQAKPIYLTRLATYARFTVEFRILKIKTPLWGKKSPKTASKCDFGENKIRFLANFE